ncbi:MAG: helix-turn-helix transcriptional regulator [Spirochaetales bacterium]|nr:helix-turn-helix transcriptional regulator [Spirochaetales bacterium]
MRNLKKYRKEAGLTQEKLAELCDTDPRYIGQLETGRRCPSLIFIEKIAGALKIAPALLFWNEAESEQIGQALGIQKEAFTRALVESVSERIQTLSDKYF